MRKPIPKGARTLLIELNKVRRAQQREDLTDDDRAELRGALQALAWARGEDAMAPAKAALLGKSAPTREEPNG